jgi:hypothetical protein
MPLAIAEPSGLESRVLDRRKGYAQHEVEINLEPFGYSLQIRVGEPPLPASVFTWNALDGETFAGANSLDRLLDLWLVFDHHVTFRRADVVEVDVRREPWDVKKEKVERGATLERDARAQESVRLECFEQAQKPKHLLQRAGSKPVLSRDLSHLFGIELHATSFQVRAKMRSGTIRFQRGSSLPPLR